MVNDRMTDRGEAWADQEVRQRRARLKLSYRERLAWLNQAKEFAALASGAARRGTVKSEAQRGRT